MRKFTKTVKRDRQLSQEQLREYDGIRESYETIMKQLAQYPDDPDIKELENEVIRLAMEADNSKNEYLATPIEEIVEYDVDMELFDEIKQRVENFKKLVAL